MYYLVFESIDETLSMKKSILSELDNLIRSENNKKFNKKYHFY